MKIPKLDKEIKIDNKAMPIFLEGGDTAVIIFHGYLGSPDEVAYLAQKLNKIGYTVSVPRLPGHGTSVNDFIMLRADDWVRKAIDTCLEIKSRYNKIIIAGFSMGALLAIVTASLFPPESLILIAPAVTNNKRIRMHLLFFIIPFIKKIKKRKIYKTNNDFDSYLAKEYWSYRWPASAFSIIELQKEAVKRLSMIKCKTFLIASEEDKAVPMKAVNMIREKIPSDLLTVCRLKNSHHVIFKGPEKEEAWEAALGWLNNI